VNEARKLAIYKSLIDIVACILILLGLLVMIGWWTHAETLIRVLPKLPPMQFNTALGFLLTGLSLLFSLRKLRLSVALGGLIFLIGFITALEYLFSIKSGIDNIFTTSHLHKEINPGRMALNSTLCLLIIGFILMSRLIKNKWRILIFVNYILSLIVICVGVVSLIGYIAEIMSAYTLGKEMAAHSAASFVICGLSLALLVRIDSAQYGLKNIFLLPTGIIVFGMVLFSLLYYALDRNEDSKIKQIVIADTKIAADSTTKHIMEPIYSLRRMKNRLQSGLMSPKLWMLDAEQYFNHFSSIIALGINTDGSWTEKIFNRNLAVKSGQKYLDQCYSSYKSIPGKINESIMQQSDRQSHICVIYKIIFKGKPTELFGVINLNQIMQSANQNNFTKGYGLALLNGSQILYQYQPNSKSVKSWGSLQPVKFDDINLQLFMWPDQNLIRSYSSWLPLLTSLIGFLVTLLLGITVLTFALARQRAQKLKESEQRFHLLVDNIKDYAILMLDPKGNVATWNSGAEQIKGYRADEIIGKNFSRFYTEEDKANNHPKEVLQKALQAGRYEEEGWRVKKDGTKFWASVTLTPLYIKEEMIGFGKITRDLTERKRIDLIKNEFISMVSHELRTPLTAIHGSISLLEGNKIIKMPDQALDLLRIAKKNSERLTNLINDILDIEKIEAGKMDFNTELHKINALVAEGVKANQAYAAKFSVNLRLVQLIDDATVMVDHARVIQVLNNLISNAIKFSPTDSEVRVTILQPQNNRIRVEVTDQGSGIPKEFHAKIFQKFSQANSSASRQHSGTGLGLSISKLIIEKLKGTIGFNTQQNQGTTFYFEIPAYHEEAAKRTQNVKKIILICESDIEIVQDLKLILENEGLEIILVNNMLAIKDRLNQGGIDAVILDLDTADIDAANFIKNIRASANYDKLPILIISLKNKENKIADLNHTSLNVVDWIEKPVDIRKLLTAVKSLKERINNSMPNILHVEDDIDLFKIVSKVLEGEGILTNATNLKEARHFLQNNHYHLVILDINLPDGTGIELLSSISEKNIPIIVFSAYEFPREYFNKVNAVLMKSKTSNETLLKAVRNVIAQKDQ